MVDLASSLHTFVVVEVSVYVRECGQDLSLFAIWNECVYCMRGGVVYIPWRTSFVAQGRLTTDHPGKSRLALGAFMKSSALTFDPAHENSQ